MTTSKWLLAGMLLLFLAVALLYRKPGPDLEASITRGAGLYNGYCAGCHKENGTGYPNHRLKTPPLAGADYLLNTKEMPVRALLNGLDTLITVNGVEYDRSMPAVEWTDREISDVLNYARHAWDNEAEYISEEEVKEIRMSLHEHLPGLERN